jgi:hypothetical protein
MNLAKYPLDKQICTMEVASCKGIKKVYRDEGRFITF